MQFDNQSKDGEINFKALFFKYTLHWKWFLFSVLVFLALAKLYLRYSIPVYRATTSILIKDEDSGGMLSELAAFQDLGLMSGGKKNIDDEIEILRSRALIGKTIKNNKFNISYIFEGRVKSGEVYEEHPIDINFDYNVKDFFEKDTIVIVKMLSNKKFELFDANENELGQYSYGQNITSNKLGTFNITLTGKNKTDNFNQNIIISLCSMDKAIDTFKGKMDVTPVAKFSNVIEITFADQVKDKAEDFLDKIVEIYNQEAIADKNLISEKTAKFINERLDIITTELGGVEKEAESYKKKNKITDLPTEAELYLRTASEVKSQEMSAGSQIKIVDLMIDHMRSNKNTDIIPVNIIPSDNNSSTMIGEYNSLVVERNRILKSSTPDNPVVVRVDEKIQALKSSINESLLKLRSSLVVKNRDINNEGNQIGGRIAQIPKQEREFRNIYRQQQIKEELYLYLFKKREETAITLAGTAPISKIVDSAYSSSSPVSPNNKIIYIISLVFGLLIPFSIIYVKGLLDTKVKDRHDLDHLGVPFIGDVPHSESHNEIIKSDSRTSSAEAIRIVRTNLEFILNNTERDKAKTVMLTSTLPAEGKTFIAVNLAATIAISGKKVLLIGMDVRNPRIDDYVTLPSKGLTNFLSTNDAVIEEYIVSQSGYEHFDILPAGVIPPNPAELLMSVKLETMFEDLKKQYDYIVIDTAPVSLVTDTLLISKFADAFIYVVRANYLERDMLKISETLYREKKLPSMCMLLNDTDVTKGYGYGYGYGVREEKKKSWFNRIFSILG